LFFLTFLGRDLPLVPLQILPRFVRRSPLPMVFNSFQMSFAGFNKPFRLQMQIV
jgi:hypothetical protein